MREEHLRRIEEMERALAEGRTERWMGPALVKALDYARATGDRELEGRALGVVRRLMEVLPGERVELRPGEVKEISEGLFAELRGSNLVIYVVEEAEGDAKAPEGEEGR